MFVPESTLADPMVLNFKILERQRNNSSSNSSYTGFSSSNSSTGSSSDYFHRRLQSCTATNTCSSSTINMDINNNNDDWCVQCEGEASTVYRVLDGETLQPLLQLKIMYTTTLFGMPQYHHHHSSSSNNNNDNNNIALNGFTVKEGKCYLVIDKVTTTTSRDWNGEKL